MFVYLHKTPLLWDVNFLSSVDKTCDQLAGTSIVKDLLSLATRDDLSDEIKQNVAIALAKLVKRDLRYVFLE